MITPVSLDSIPNREKYGKIQREIEAFLRTDAEAGIIDNDGRSAESTAASYQVIVKRGKYPVRVVRRMGTVYLVRKQPDEL
jgi:hypothetical protein